MEFQSIQVSVTGDDQQQQESEGKAPSTQEGKSESNMVQIDMPTEEMESSLVTTEPQHASEKPQGKIRCKRMAIEDMEMMEEWDSTHGISDSEQRIEGSREIQDLGLTHQFSSTAGLMGDDQQQQGNGVKASSIHEGKFGGMIVGMGRGDMKMMEEWISSSSESENGIIPKEEEEEVSRREKSFEGNEFQKAYDDHGNLKLLHDAYLSVKGSGDVSSANRNIISRALPPALGDKTRLFEDENIFRQESPQRNTLLHIAAMHGNDDLVKQITQQAPHLLGAENSNGDTALHLAAKAGYISTLKMLLAAHLRNLQHPFSEIPLDALNKIFVTNLQGNTFFHDALYNRQQGIIDFLVSDEELEQFDAGFKELVELVSLFLINKEKKSVLYLAIEAGYKEFVAQALAKLNNETLSPALNKLIENHPALTKLIPQGPLYVPAGKSPLLAAILKRDQGILDTILKQKPEWIHLPDTKRRIPLHCAASIGYLEGVQKLLEKCAPCASERDELGFFPLHLASYGGHVKVVQELLKPEHCPYPREILDHGGRNILHIAIEGGKFDVVRYILQAAKTNPELEKMINDRDANGNTPLHVASLGCHPKIVHALTWDQRVDLNLVNNKDQTALEACKHFRLENPSLPQRLTWIALKSAGVRSDNPSPLKVPPPVTGSSWKQKAQRMESYKDRINTLMLVSTLIITVTFAAGFTLPGGTNDSDPGQGMAVMLHRMWFKLFMFCITISMYGAISVTIILIWAQLDDLKLALLALKVARPILGVTLATLSLAFLAGVHLVISDISWLATTILVMCVTFIVILMLLYILIWFPSSSSIRVLRYISYYPFLMLASLVERTKQTRGNSSTS